MSETTRYSPWAEPGAAAVTFLPKMTEQPEPGGVSWTTRKSAPSREVGVEAPSELLPVKLLRAVDVRDGYYNNFEFHVHECCLPLFGRSACGAAGLPRMPADSRREIQQK